MQCLDNLLSNFRLLLFPKNVVCYLRGTRLVLFSVRTAPSLAAAVWVVPVLRRATVFGLLSVAVFGLFSLTKAFAPRDADFPRTFNVLWTTISSKAGAPISERTGLLECCFSLFSFHCETTHDNGVSNKLGWPVGLRKNTVFDPYTYIYPI